MNPLKVDLIPLSLDNSDHIECMFNARIHQKVCPFLLGNPPASYDEHRHYLQSVKNKNFFLLKADDKLVGYCQSTYLSDEIELGWVLHPDFWGKGFGSIAIKQLIELMRPHKKKIIIFVKKTNVRALALYKKHLFKMVDFSNDDVFKMELA